MDTVANVRMHEATHQRPIDRFEVERAHLGRLNPAGFDLARVCLVRANPPFRVALDSNHYSVLSRYAGQRLTLKAHADRVCIYFLASLLPDTYPEWEKSSIVLNLLVAKLPAPQEEDLSKGILQAIDMDTYRVEKKARMALADADRVAKRIRDDIAPKVATDKAFQNARANTPHTARMAHDQALGKVMQILLKDDTQFYKQFVENESFRRFVGDMVYELTRGGECA